MALVNFEKNLIVKYGLGDLPVYCYRVESYCYYNNTPGAPINTCNGCANGQTVIQTICATSVNEVCKQLKALDLNMDIQSMCQWSNTLYGPYGGGASATRDTYGSYTAVKDFCKNPDCIDFCLGIKANVNITAISFAITDNNIIKTQGGFELIGSSNAYATKYQYVVSNNRFSLNGSASVSQTGGIEGTGYVGSGGFQLFGSATSKGSDMGTYVQDFSINMTSVELTAVLIPTSGNNLFGFGGRSRSDICDCKNAPYQLSLKHNLNKSSELTRFLTRNNLALPTIITMLYYEDLGYYTANLSYNGISSFVNNNENWYLSFNLFCTGELNQFANRYNWKLTINIRRSTIGFASEETSIVIYLLSNYICPPNNADNFGFKTNLDVKTLLLTVNNIIFVNSSNINDGISLFLSNAWLADPVLNISVGN